MGPAPQGAAMALVMRLLTFECLRGSIQPRWPRSAVPGLLGMHPSHKVSALPGDGQVVRSNLKARIAVAAVTGAVLATGVLIWVSYRLARGSGFGGRSSDWGTVAAWAVGSRRPWRLGWRCWCRRCSTRSVDPVAEHLRARRAEVPHRGTRRAARAGRGRRTSAAARRVAAWDGSLAWPPHRGDHHLANTARC